MASRAFNLPGMLQAKGYTQNAKVIQVSPDWLGWCRAGGQFSKWEGISRGQSLAIRGMIYAVFSLDERKLYGFQLWDLPGYIASPSKNTVLHMKWNSRSRNHLYPGLKNMFTWSAHVEVAWCSRYLSVACPWNRLRPSWSQLGGDREKRSQAINFPRFISPEIGIVHTVSTRVARDPEGLGTCVVVVPKKRRYFWLSWQFCQQRPRKRGIWSDSTIFNSSETNTFVFCHGLFGLSQDLRRFHFFWG